MLASEFKALFEENLWNEVSSVEFRPADAPIIVPVDEIVHTDEQPYCCDPTCPCQLEVEDEMSLTFPTEEQLDAQERSVLDEDEPAYDAPHCPQQPGLNVTTPAMALASWQPLRARVSPGCWREYGKVHPGMTSGA